MNPKNNKARCLAIFGTGSDVGKSILTTALCRFFLNKGFRTAPFKAQNMSNNSGVTVEGLEMGRAQIVQAEAARILPFVDMNPILLKPTTDVGCQVVVMGRAIANHTALEYHQKKRILFSAACDSLDRLRSQYDLVVIEGAGSCAEVNLMAHDIVNFRMAEYADAPVILVADIHRGGVFGQIVGTLECLEQRYRDRIAGFIINRFRGDIRLFDEGVRWIESRTGKPVFGVLPWYDHIRIEAEDSVVIESPPTVSVERLGKPAIAVIRLPHISNFTDFAPLSALKELDLIFIEKNQDLSGFAAVILPGSKNTRFDLDWLKRTGWAEKLRYYADGGGYVLGICGGFQIMGTHVHDPDGVEGPSGSSTGLGLLPVETVLTAPKTTTLSRFAWEDTTAAGYEIHMGRSERKQGQSWFRVLEQNGEPPENTEEGCIAADGRIMATYMHGLFDTPEIIRKWLGHIGLGHIPVPQIYGGPAGRDPEYERLARHLETHTDTEAILKLIACSDSCIE